MLTRQAYDAELSCVTMRSPAKINVFLEVLGRRADGFHELETVMLRTRFSDVLQFRRLPEPEIQLRLHPATLPSMQRSFPLDASNLIVRVAKDLQRQCDCRLGVEVTVLKRIPPESGLAGGSGNAAVTLTALNQLWRLPLSDDDLHTVAARHGSDINFLLSQQRAAVCRGRGEIVEPITLSRTLFFVAIRPHQGNRTGDVFQRTEIPLAPVSSAGVVAVLTGQQPGRIDQCCFNRLTLAASQCNPEMAELMTWLVRRLQRPVFMSGSGSTCFLIAHNRREAGRLLAVVQAGTQRPAWILQC